MVVHVRVRVTPADSVKAVRTDSIIPFKAFQQELFYDKHGVGMMLWTL